MAKYRKKQPEVIVDALQFNDKNILPILNILKTAGKLAAYRNDDKIELGGQIALKNDYFVLFADSSIRIIPNSEFKSNYEAI